MLFKIPKMSPNSWTIFERKIVARIIQKSPNLATLDSLSTRNTPLKTNPQNEATTTFLIYEDNLRQILFQ